MNSHSFRLVYSTNNTKTCTDEKSRPIGDYWYVVRSTVGNVMNQFFPPLRATMYTDKFDSTRWRHGTKDKIPVPRLMYFSMISRRQTHLLLPLRLFSFSIVDFVFVFLVERERTQSWHCFDILQRHQVRIRLVVTWIWMVKFPQLLVLMTLFCNETIYNHLFNTFDHLLAGQQRLRRLRFVFHQSSKRKWIKRGSIGCAFKENKRIQQAKFSFDQMRRTNTEVKGDWR